MKREEEFVDPLDSTLTLLSTLFQMACICNDYDVNICYRSYAEYVEVCIRSRSKQRLIKSSRIELKEKNANHELYEMIEYLKSLDKTVNEIAKEKYELAKSLIELTETMYCYKKHDFVLKYHPNLKEVGIFIFPYDDVGNHSTEKVSVTLEKKNAVESIKGLIALIKLERYIYKQ